MKFAIGYALALIPLSFVIPFEWSFENGFIENFQVVILIGSGIFSLYLRSQSADSEIRAFNLWCALIFFLLAARELSYGGVFFLDFEDENGRHYVPNSRQPWYQELHILIGIYIAMLVIMLKKLPIKKILSIKIPIQIVTILIIGIIFSTIGDHKYLFDFKQSQVLEELSECLMYGMLPMLCRYYDCALKI